MKDRGEGKGKRRIALFALLFLCIFAGCGNDQEGKRLLSGPWQMNAAGYSIGVPESAAATTLVEEKFPRSRIKYFRSIAEGYAAVQYGKIDAFAFDRHALQYVTIQNPELALMDEKIGDESIVVGAAPGREDLIKKVNAFIGRYRADGTYQKMYERWILRKDSKMPDLPEGNRPVATLKIGTTGVNEPMNFYAGGRLAGFDAEFAKRLAGHLNVRCEFVIIEYPAIVAAAASGKIDLLIANLNATSERRKMMLFSDPYVDSEISFLVRKDRLVPARAGAIATIAELSGKKVGVQTGTTYEAVLKNSIPEAHPVYFTTFTDQIEALKTNKISGFLVDEVVAQNMIRQTPGLAYIRKWLRSNDYAFALSKSRSDLHGQVNVVLEEIRQDGSLKALEAKWFGADEATKVLPDLKLSGPNGVIRFATNSDCFPFAYMKNGRLVGYDIEAAMMVAAKLGRRLEFLDMDFAAIIPSLASGKTDMAGAFIAITPERAQSVLFTSPTYAGGTVVVVAAVDADDRAGSGITGLTELSGKKVGIVTGSSYDDLLKRQLPETTPAYFNNFSDQVAAVKAGKIAGFLVDEPMARDILNHTTGVTYLKQTLSADGYAFALAKDKPELLNQVNAALKAMRDDGTLKMIEARWFGNDEAAKVLPDLDLAGPNGVLQFGTNSGAAPFAYMKDGKIVGYDVEIALRLARRLGYTLEITDMDFAALIPSLKSGRSDLIAGGITVTEERAKSVSFSIPDYSGGVVVMVASDAAPGGRSWIGKLWSGFAKSFHRTFIIEDRYKMILGGLGVTLLITLLSAFFGTLLGFVVCLMRRAATRLASVPARMFIRTVQGTPIVVLLMILYYVVFGSLDISAIVVAVIGFSINFAAYTSEMMRTGIDAVDKGQSEAALALGFDRIQVFTKITFPQAARHALPVFRGEVISMLKMTSVVGYIAIQDLTKISDIIRSRTYEAFFPLLATALIYFIIAYAAAHLLTELEKSIDPKKRKRIVKGVLRP